MVSTGGRRKEAPKRLVAEAAEAAHEPRKKRCRQAGDSAGTTGRSARSDASIASAGSHSKPGEAARARGAKGAKPAAKPMAKRAARAKGQLASAILKPAISKAEKKAQKDAAKARKKAAADEQRQLKAADAKRRKADEKERRRAAKEEALLARRAPPSASAETATDESVCDLLSDIALSFVAERADDAEHRRALFAPLLDGAAPGPPLLALAERWRNQMHDAYGNATELPAASYAEANLSLRLGAIGREKRRELSDAWLALPGVVAATGSRARLTLFWSETLRHFKKLNAAPEEVAPRADESGLRAADERGDRMVMGVVGGWAVFSLKGVCSRGCAAPSRSGSCRCSRRSSCPRARVRWGCATRPPSTCWRASSLGGLRRSRRAR